MSGIVAELGVSDVNVPAVPVMNGGTSPFETRIHIEAATPAAVPDSKITALPARFPRARDCADVSTETSDWAAWRICPFVPGLAPERTSPKNTAMMEVTTRSSTSVKAVRWRSGIISMPPRRGW